MEIKREVKRDQSVDILRGVAILLMIYGHIIDYGITFDVCVDTQKTIFEYIYNFIYAFHMPLFFALSGYVMGYKEIPNGKQLGSSIRKDVVSLYVPYLLFVIIYWFERYCAVKILGVQLADPIETKLKDVISLLFNGKSLTWFLLAMLIVRTAFKIIANIGGTSIAGIFFGLCFVVDSLTYIRGIHYLSYGVYFVLGYYICAIKQDKTKEGKYSWLVNVFLATVWIAVVSAATIKPCNIYCVNGIIAMTLSGILLIIRIPKSLRWLSCIGKQTMAVYFIHGIINGIAVALVYNLLKLPYNLGISLFIMFIQIAMICGVIALSTVPCMKWIHYIFYPSEMNFFQKYIYR